MKSNLIDKKLRDEWGIDLVLFYSVHAPLNSRPVPRFLAMPSTTGLQFRLRHRFFAHDTQMSRNHMGPKITISAVMIHPAMLMSIPCCSGPAVQRAPAAPLRDFVGHAEQGFIDAFQFLLLAGGQFIVIDRQRWVERHLLVQW